MYAEERRLHILDVIKRNKRIEVTDLAEKLDISAETIRRDLKDLESNGFLKRTHGGAIYIGGGQSSRPLISMLSRQKVNAENKAAVARLAATFVEDGDVVAVDNSTTVGSMFQFIPASRNFTVITYSLQMAMEIAGKPDCAWKCVCLGGAVDPDNLSMHGVLASTSLSFFQPLKLFMSCAGVDARGRMTEGTLTETEIKRELLACCREKFLLIDESKWGQAGTANEGSVADVDCLITNVGVSRADVLAVAGDSGVRILLDDGTVLTKK